MLNMFNLMGKIGEVQDRMQEIKSRLPGIMLEESELDGTVTVSISADKKIRNIALAPSFYSQLSEEEREAILTEAVNNAVEKAEARAKEEMRNGLKGVMPDIPGFDLDSLPFGI